MAYKSLRHFIQKLEENNELIRVKEFVNPELEITEIVDRFSKSPNGGKALLFENNGTRFPLLINSMGSEKRIQLALGVENLNDIGREIEKLFGDLTRPKKNLIEKLKILPGLSRISSWMPKIIKGKAVSQEVVIKNPDLGILPVLKCWPEDGGRFITLPVVVTKDPNTGIRNVGMYRMQVFDKNLTGMHWHKHKVGARHFEEYKKLELKMPVVVALGGDPAYTYSATAPVPDNIDEFMLAGFLRKKRVELVKCITQDIEVPADADIIIEGYIDPQENLIWEGPFGDHTGFYSLADWFPGFHVTCITHKKDAVYPATVVGIPPMEDAWIGKATERIFLTPLKYAMLPEIIDFDLPFAGVAHNLTIVKIKKSYSGQAIKVMNSLWGAGQMMFNKILIVVDTDVDIHNYENILHVMNKNVQPDSDLHFSMGPLDILDHSATKYAFGSKLGIDATNKFPDEINNENNENLNKISKESIDKLIKKYPEIKSINANYDSANLLVIALEKENRSKLETLAKNLSESEEFGTTRFCLFVDSEVDVSDFNMVAWLVLGNIDPKRDTIQLKINGSTRVFFDGTRKSFKKDQFERNWPNILISNEETIKTIDEKWQYLGLGKFIQSPSGKYKKLNKSKGAQIEE
ncbi:MAG: menaquinone biosynthesis decarboxylase [Bacteroidetes bacterium GWC2_33_15]|nr:MAG: menaquinone biosynthesis decarboxylase [Bacteroidetes bacterium GWA2_33_15]OFX52435.1 MAG: menaquinone biosynthesis decarboxylase [Bacteroidetes bacterium GWC2_33_15]OFX65497.1 MAG: menaquinone biosynthesis decarboxylase [Bacteroidetes bacterium GWB2_32_14]OFX67516.1 MAG: menaquinone biosynthesis decarboxylase [Bacteroidetes bacterium GWD2_33_33]HAN18442.1 menaquinone biosynthesis decarboxylase [Bacteroidales bacterium]